MIHFLHLIRYTNLIIIAITMYGIRFFYFSIGGKINPTALSEPFDYLLLVVSTLFIAAAGNCINDYFDIKADRINRPESVIITKHFSKRFAISTHWILNSIAFLISIYLSIRYHTYWYVFIHLLSINALWIYSIYLKKKFLIGNLLIACLTALVVLLCGIHFYQLCSYTEGISLHAKIKIPVSIDQTIVYWKQLFLDAGNFIILLCSFSFILNLSREIIKDIEDVEGDLAIEAKTIPIVMGKKAAKRIVIATLMVLPIAYFSFLLFYVNSEILLHIIATFTLFCSSMIICISIILLLFNNQTRAQYKRIDRIIKVAMFMGILTPFYWWLM